MEIIPDQPAGMLSNLPDLRLDHIKRLTTRSGILRHAKYGIPDFKEGYCLNDNAMAVVLSLMAEELGYAANTAALLPVYLRYLQYMQLPDGRFRDRLSFSGQHLDEQSSEDTLGRAIWALGYTSANAADQSSRDFAEDLFRRSIPQLATLLHLRSKLLAVIGISLYLPAHTGESGLSQLFEQFILQITESYHTNNIDGSPWFETQLTYDSSLFPLALLYAYPVSNDRRLLKIALDALSFINSRQDDLTQQTTHEKMMLSLTYLQANKVNHNPLYLEQIYAMFLWFHGKNPQQAPYYNSHTAGCFDAISATCNNRNQGAASTLAYLITHLALLKVLADQQAIR